MRKSLLVAALWRACGGLVAGLWRACGSKNRARIVVVEVAPTLRLKSTGFEKYGLALGKIALQIFRLGTLRGRSHFLLKGGSRGTAEEGDGRERV